MGEKLDRDQMRRTTESHENDHEMDTEAARVARRYEEVLAGLRDDPHGSPWFAAPPPESPPGEAFEDWPEEALERLWRAIWSDATLGGTDGEDIEERRGW